MLSEGTMIHILPHPLYSCICWRDTFLVCGFLDISSISRVGIRDCLPSGILKCNDFFYMYFDSVEWLQQSKYEWDRQDINTFQEMQPVNFVSEEMCSSSTWILTSEELTHFQEIAIKVCFRRNVCSSSTRFHTSEVCAIAWH